MSKLLEKHQLTPNLFVYKQDNCLNWMARLKLNKAYITRSTKTKELEQAIAKAHRLYFEFEIRFETNIFVAENKKFTFVADKVIQQMHQALAAGTGKMIYEDYVGALRKYHIPFFCNTYVTQIGIDQLTEFDQWRVAQLGRIPAKSTVQNHNSALQMVFDYAVKKKWMLASQVPALENNGAAGQRRAAFSVDEYLIVREKIEEMRQESRKERTQHIRELLLDYMDFAVLTGMRPGSEMDNLTWSDIHLERDTERCRFYITVRKGKTTKFTGTREIVCKEAIVKVLQRLSHRFPNRHKDDFVFRVPDGSSVKEMPRHFDKALELTQLKNSQQGERSLYSLRHSYITWELVAQNVSIDVLARQCGTGIQMIEQHYSHVIPRMFGSELSGVVLETKKMLTKQFSEVEYDEQLQYQIERWSKNYKRRGFI